MDVMNRHMANMSYSMGSTMGRMGNIMPYYEIREARSLPRPVGEGWGEGTIRGEAAFHHPGWLASPHDR